MNWRFIPYAEFDGAENMAIDVSLLAHAASRPPVLRLYGFSPPCLSIGLAQKLDLEVIERVKSRGFDIVRRPSGGRAVLHYKDLTYSFIACQKGTGNFAILEHSVSAAYKQICAGLQEAFLLLGLRAELGQAETNYRHLADCFLATTNADLHFRGRKLAGSAQLRRNGCVLQHGSIPLMLEQDLVPELLGAQRSSPEPEPQERHANLFDMLGRKYSFAQLDQAMKAGFEKAFSVELQAEELKLDELKEALELKKEFSSIN